MISVLRKLFQGSPRQGSATQPSPEWDGGVPVPARAEDRRQAGAIGPSDAVDTASSRDEMRSRAEDRRQAFKRAIYLALSLAAIALSARAVLGERGLLDAHRSQAELTALQTEVETWKQRNELLEKRVKALREDPATIEGIARERLDWIRPGEITFLLPHDPAASDPGDPGPVAPGEFSPTQPGDVEETPEPAGPASSRP